MFDDFMLKIDGEMIRRNRLYQDTMTEFESINAKVSFLEQK